MNVKRSLQNRIRGWFPDSPKFHELIKNNFDAQNRRPQSNYLYAKKQESLPNCVVMLFLTIACSINLFVLLLQQSLTYWLVMIILGIIVGLFLAILPTNYDLKMLLQGDKTNAKLSGIISVVFPLTTLIIICCFAWLQFRITEFDFSLLTFCWANIIAIFSGRVALFAVWGRKNNFEIWVGNGFNLFIIPKSSSKSGFSTQEGMRS